MARKAGKYICNRCGRKIDTANDLDCVEAKTFQTKSITEMGSGPEDKFTRVDKATKLHFCGKCMDMLMQYVYDYEYKKPPISEEIVRCRDCVRRYKSECPLYINNNGKQKYLDNRNDFFCGYGERVNEKG